MSSAVPSETCDTAICNTKTAVQPLNLCLHPSCNSLKEKLIQMEAQDCSMGSPKPSSVALMASKRQGPAKLHLKTHEATRKSIDQSISSTANIPMASKKQAKRIRIREAAGTI